MRFRHWIKKYQEKDLAKPQDAADALDAIADEFCKGSKALDGRNECSVQHAAHARDDDLSWIICPPRKCPLECPDGKDSSQCSPRTIQVCESKKLLLDIQTLRRDNEAIRKRYSPEEGDIQR